MSSNRGGRGGAGSSSRGNRMAQNFVDRQVDRQIEKHRADNSSGDEMDAKNQKKGGFAENNAEWVQIKTDLYQNLTGLRDTIAKRKVVQKNEGNSERADQMADQIQDDIDSMRRDVGRLTEIIVAKKKQVSKEELKAMQHDVTMISRHLDRAELNAQREVKLSAAAAAALAEASSEGAEDDALIDRDRPAARSFTSRMKGMDIDINNLGGVRPLTAEEGGVHTADNARGGKVDLHEQVVMQRWQDQDEIIDDQLDAMGNRVARLKPLAQGINDEAALHNEKIEDLYDRMDDAETRIEQQTKMMKKVIRFKKKARWCIIWTIVFLAMICVVVTIVIKMG